MGGNSNESNEDIHIGVAGANYGWNNCEGFDCGPPLYEPPFFSREHLDFGIDAGTAIVGGVVYRGDQFPQVPYYGAYFYGDFSQTFIHYLTIDSNGDLIGDNPFESGIDKVGLVVDIKQGPDGSLYFVQIASNFNFVTNSGALRRITFNDGNQAPQITSATADVTTGGAPLAVVFNGTATDAENDTLEYIWDFGDGQQVTGATGTNVSHTYQNNGTYQARLQVSETRINGRTTTLEPPLVITVGSPPTVTIDGPVNGAFFNSGDTINFSASATDDGSLTEDSYKWTVLFTHNNHTHPEAGPISGSSGTLLIPSSGHSFNGNTGFQLNVEVTDEDGLKANQSVNISPNKSNINFTSVPTGISFFIDTEIFVTPTDHNNAIGFESIVTAPQTQG